MTFINIVFTAPGEAFSKTASINIDAFPSKEEAIASVVPEGSRWETLSPGQKELPEGYVCFQPEPPPPLTITEKLAALGIDPAELKATLETA